MHNSQKKALHNSFILSYFLLIVSLDLDYYNVLLSLILVIMITWKTIFEKHRLQIFLLIFTDKRIVRLSTTVTNK